MKLKRMLALVLTIAMVLSVAVLPVNAASEVQYTDVEEGHWSEGSIYRWTEAGVVQGVSETEALFAPANEISRSEVAQILNNVLGLKETVENTYPDVEVGAWYEAAILACAKANILAGDGYGMAPTRLITRQEVFVMLARSLNLAGEADLTAFGDVAQVADWADAETEAMVAHKIIEGRPGADGNLLAPEAKITRAEVVKMLDRMIGAYVTADGKISLTSEDETVGNIVVVNANCESDVMITLAADGETVNVAVADGETASFVADNGMVYVVIVNEDSAEVTALQSVKVHGATEEKQAYIQTVPVTLEPEHVCTNFTETTTGCCAAGRVTTKTCKDCGESTEEPADATTHKFDDAGICTECGEDKNDDAQKFHLAVESNETAVYANVTDDYAAELVVEYGEVYAGEVTVSAKMNEVASLGGGIKAHEIVVSTGMTQYANLHNWLDNAWEFKTATVGVTVTDNDGAKTFDYYLKGEEKLVNDDKSVDAVITATPSSVTAAREAWQKLAGHVETETQATDNSYVEVANSSSVQIGTEILVFEEGADNMKLDNFNDINALKDEVKDSVMLITGEGDKIEVVAGAGTKLAVGQSIATLKDMCTITITGVEGVPAILGQLKTAANESNSTYAIMEKVMLTLNSVIKGANENKNIEVVVAFTDCTHESYPAAFEGDCATGVTAICACGEDDPWEETVGHVFEGNTCTICGADKAEAMKFAVNVTAGEGYVNATVTDDYVAVIESNYGKVDASNVTLRAEMQNVGSLGVDEKRSHEVTIDTGLTGDPDLAVWLSNAKNFKDATVVATIDGNAVIYELAGTEGTIVAAPTDVADARAAWQALTANISTSTGTDSQVVIANGSTLQIAGEKLVFESEDDLVLDNFSDLDAMEALIRENVKLVEGENTLVAVLKKGTALAVGSSVATLDKDATITITGIANDQVTGILSTMKNAESTQAMAESLVKLINNVIGSVDAAGAEVCVDITFG